MDLEEQKQFITNSLKAAIGAVEECNAEYRVIGSVLIIAHLGKVYRPIHDVDILIDSKCRECVFERLKKEGFVLARKTAFPMYFAEKAQHIPLNLHFGDFTKDSVRFHICGRICEWRITADSMLAKKYVFNGVEFTGLPMSAMIRWIKASPFLKATRRFDREVLSAEMAKANVASYKVRENIYILGIKIPFLYHFSLLLRNICRAIQLRYTPKKP
jgi:hypothetical protein